MQGKLFTTVLILATFAFVAQAEIHAVLCAGSKGYSNYRHQSDICHAYQILIGNGVPAENIIVLSYDDAAHSPQNPIPGTLFNKPTQEGEKSENVYAGCKIDYSGDEVTPDNYLAVITGNSTAVTGGNGRVLNSGPDDMVFLNFVDHGEPGVMDFPPNGIVSQRLYANQINEAFVTMHSKNMYKQLTYYLETCYSGSIFESTPTNLNLYAVSAANAHQSSWAAYCPPMEDVVEGKHLKTCLGDLFSVNWMQDSQDSNTQQETLQEQFEKVKGQTAATASHAQGSEVMQWGDVTFTNEVIGTFIGNNQKQNNGFLNKLAPLFKRSQQSNKVSQNIQSIQEAETNYLIARFQESPTMENYEALNADLLQTKKLNKAFEGFMEKFGRLVGSSQSNGTDFSCYKSLIDNLEAKCGMINDFSRPHLLNLYNFCANTHHFPYEQVVFEC